MRWLSGPSSFAVTEALRAVAPELSGLPIDIPDLTGLDDPAFQSSSAALGEDFFVKFAWSEPTARRLLHQISVLESLGCEPAVPFLPEVVASCTDPLVLVTRRVRGSSLFKVVGSIDTEYAGMQIARFLSALHGDEARRRVEAVTGAVPAWYPLVTTGALRERFGRWVTPEQQRKVVLWCDWADEILGEPRQPVLVHGDNQVWDGGELKAVLDFENVGTGEPEYELRAFPGPGMGPGGVGCRSRRPLPLPRRSIRRLVVTSRRQLAQQTGERLADRLPHHLVGDRVVRRGFCVHDDQPRTVVNGHGHQARRRIDLQAGAHREEDGAGAGDGGCLAEHRRAQVLTEHHRRRFQYPSALQARRIRLASVQPGERVLDRGSRSARGTHHRARRAVQLEYLARWQAGLLVEAVGVLRDHTERDRAGPVKLGDRAVRGVRPRVQRVRLAAHLPGAAPDLLVGHVVLERHELFVLRVKRPQAPRTAVVGDTGVGGDPGAGEDRDKWPAHVTDSMNSRCRNLPHRFCGTRDRALERGRDLPVIPGRGTAPGGA
jgi:Phosphotransferase enzyme family